MVDSLPESNQQSRFVVEGQLCETTGTVRAVWRRPLVMERPWGSKEHTYLKTTDIKNTLIERSEVFL